MFIANVPARAFILNHRSHVYSKLCSKCKVSGTQVQGRYVFNDVNHIIRTDEKYISLYEDHHKAGYKSIIIAAHKYSFASSI